MSELREKILAKINQTESLPTLPAVVHKVQEVVDDPNSDADDMVRILENDPAIISRILKMVNSPMFGGGLDKVTDIQQAVTRLGFYEIQHIALSTGVFQAMGKTSARIFDRKQFWKHCICTGFLSVELAPLAKTPCHASVGLIHLGGLTHDLGKILLEMHFPDLLEQCIQGALQMKEPLFQVERKLLGTDHMEIGFLLAQKWKLPDVATSILRYHHEPSKANSTFRPLVELVHLSNYICNTSDVGSGGDLGGPVFLREVWESVNLSPEQIPDLIARVLENEKELLKMIE